MKHETSVEAIPNSMLDLKRAIDEAAEKWEFVVEIKLSPVAHEKLEKEISEQSKIEVHKLTSVFGIPVIVDSSLPEDTMGIIKRKRR